jgi:hypothetical protein
MFAQSLVAVDLGTPQNVGKDAAHPWLDRFHFSPSAKNGITYATHA